MQPSKNDATSRHRLFKGLPPLSIPKGLRRTHDGSKPPADEQSSSSSLPSSNGVPQIDGSSAEQHGISSNGHGGSRFMLRSHDESARALDPAIRGAKNYAKPATSTVPESSGANELAIRPGILPDASPPDASQAGHLMTHARTQHEGAKFGMDEAAAASVKVASPCSPVTALPQIEPAPVVLQHGATVAAPGSHHSTPAYRFNEEDGTIRKIKKIGSKLAAPFAPSGDTASMSPVTQSGKLKGPEAKSRDNAKDVGAQHWSKMSRKELEAMRNQVHSDMSAFSWASAPAASVPKILRARSVSPKRVEATSTDFCYTAAPQRSTKTKQSMTSCSSSQLSSPSEQSRSPLAASSTFEDTSDEESTIDSQTSDDEDIEAAVADAPMDSARQSTRYPSKANSIFPMRSRGESIGLPDCSQDAMVRAAMFEKKLSARHSSNRNGYKEPGKARVDLMSRTSTVTGFQLCDVRNSAGQDASGSPKKIVRVRGQTF